ncbi:MAG TPA: acetyltransferase [Mariprofundaceae bacterium]|nr:acetyltransferase [Mariprofundaceae bacterium]
MKQIDVFNGDADGICALHQLRLTKPCDSELVTGVKRDINLLGRVEATKGDRITVLDISLDKNRTGLDRLLDQGINVDYFDHHFAGDIPVSEHLAAHIDTSADTCTSLIVNRYLKSAHILWALTGAFGDNMHQAAHDVARPVELSREQMLELQHLGECINYNGYGLTLDDLHFAPDDLYRHISPYVDPFAFIHESEAFKKLADGYATDIAHARDIRAHIETEKTCVHILPDQPWARRVSGVYGNELARNHPSRAHALITEADGFYRVSVRAPLTKKEHADTLCMQFPTGGGRKGAAGINELPIDMFDRFIEAFTATYS